MKRKALSLVGIILAVVTLLTACVACNADSITSEQIINGTTTGTTSGTTTTNGTSYSGTITLQTEADALYPDTYNEEDYTKWQTYDFGTEYVFNVETGSWEGDAPSSDIAKVTIKDNSLKVVNLTENPINITLTGTNDAFKVTIDGNGQAVKITLDNLNITSEDRALNIKNSSVSYIVLEGENSLETLVNSYDKNVLKSETDMIIDGTGCLSVTANSKNGIVTEYGVFCILNGDITVTVAKYTAYTDDNDTDDTSDDVVEETKGTAIKPMLGFVMLDGSLTIYGYNSDKGYESKGIKVDGYEADEVEDETLSKGMGWIVIDGGTITIRTQGKAISAGWKQSEDDNPADSANNPVPNVYINGGTFDIVTYATPRDDTKTVDGVSPEGIEAKNNVYITGGTFVINTTDDCINASNAIYISGGMIYAYASQNDAIDAGAEENQGYLYISGGVVVALGSGQPETGLDCNSDARFQYTGGIIIAMGGGQNNAPQASGTTAYTASASGLSAGKTYALVQNGEVVLAFKVPSGYSYGNAVLLGTGSLEQGTATLLSGVTATGTTADNGVVYSGSVTVSGGTSTGVTVANTSSGFGPGGQGGQQFGPGQQGGFPGGQGGRPF